MYIVDETFLHLEDLHYHLTCCTVISPLTNFIAQAVEKVHATIATCSGKPKGNNYSLYPRDGDRVLIALAKIFPRPWRGPSPTTGAADYATAL